jgi:hypothetical protein
MQVMSAFHARAGEQVASLEADLSAAVAAFGQLAAYVNGAANASVSDPQAFFTVLITFARDLDIAHKEIISAGKMVRDDSLHALCNATRVSDICPEALGVCTRMPSSMSSAVKYLLGSHCFKFCLYACWGCLANLCIVRAYAGSSADRETREAGQEAGGPWQAAAPTPARQDAEPCARLPTSPPGGPKRPPHRKGEIGLFPFPGSFTCDGGMPHVQSDITYRSFMLFLHSCILHQ